MEKMLGSNAALKKVVNLFVQGWVYCRREPTTQLHEFDTMKHVNFGTEVVGRTNEFFVWDSNLRHVISTIHEQFAQKEHWLTVFTNEKPDNNDIEGYKFSNSEYLMILDLEDHSFETGDKVIRRVQTKEEAQYINDFFDKVVIDLKKMDDPCLHYYVGEENGELTSHGRYSILDNTVCLDRIFTAEIHRGKGIAKALCQKMLLDAKEEGAVKGVLASSQMGHPLYLKLGYRDVSKMWVFERQS
ncbi:GNAT family N-acetyltransferase [Lentibacillus jeotgali]|uniref:GNAT family N-acetyltransferase n=1 Tax=Lentibacillus jeotgali TaxID=558169 RepID=UPI000262783B|nr:GNAT family N-acetyltransferase [Lentibacillus jeotgali]